MTTTADIEIAKEAIQEWQRTKEDEIERRVAFLRTVELPLKDVSETPTSVAVDEAESFITSILGT